MFLRASKNPSSSPMMTICGQLGPEIEWVPVDPAAEHVEHVPFVFPAWLGLSLMVCAAPQVDLESGVVSGFFHLSDGVFAYSAVLDDLVAKSALRWAYRKCCGQKEKIKDEEAQDRKAPARWDELCDPRSSPTRLPKDGSQLARPLSKSEFQYSILQT